MENIPKFRPYNLKDEFYLTIDREWTIKQDYTKQYTVNIESQSHGDVEVWKKKSIVRGVRHSVENKLP